MKKYAVALLLIITGMISNAQNFSVQRGHFNDDIYVYGWRNLYHDPENPVDFYHITNFGSQLDLQYSIPYPVANCDQNLRNFTADPTSGLLFCTSVNEYDTPIYKSTDFGQNWELLETEFPYPASPIALMGGVIPGEVVMTVRANSSMYGVAFTNDYFASQHLRQTYYWYFTKPETGNVQGEIFGIKNDYSSNLDFLLHTVDYGLNVITTAIDSTIVYNANGVQALKICHGAAPGEVYLITSNPPVVDSLPYVYKIYRSAENGVNFEYKSTLSFGNSDVFTDFTGGREDGSFYVVNWHYKSDLQKQVMQVFYSSDNAAGFELHEFLLDQYLENEKNENSGVGLFPNPAYDKTTIKGPLLKDTDEIAVTDITGKKLMIFTMEAQRDLFSFDCSKLQTGIYFVNLIRAGQETRSLKLIVKH